MEVAESLFQEIDHMELEEGEDDRDYNPVDQESAWTD